MLLDSTNQGRVLVAHGDPGVRFAIAQVLMQEGWCVRLASGAEELLDGLAWGADVVVLDADLPGGPVWRSPEVRWVVLDRAGDDADIRWPDPDALRRLVARVHWEGVRELDAEEVGWMLAA